jgi:hypothetical protein
MKYFSLVFICLAVVLWGCVSSSGLGEDDKIFIESTPSGARVLVNNEIVGITPLMVKLPRTPASVYLKVVKEGYQPEEIVLSPKAEPVSMRKRNAVVNSTAFFGGIGLVAGLASGIPLGGLLGGSLLGLGVGLLQEPEESEKPGELSTNWEFSPKDLHIKLAPLWGK